MFDLREMDNHAGMGTVAAIALLWIGFGGAHVLLSSHGVREPLRERLGADGFRGLYSVVVLALFVALVWVFATHKHAGPLLWTTLGPPEVARAINYVLMLLAGILLVASLLPGSAAPSSMTAGPSVPQPHGVLRVTRHPMLAAFGIFGVAHLFTNGSLGDVVFFSGWPLFAWLGARHQDARLARDRPGYATFADATSAVPFAAIARGRQQLEPREISLAVIGIGVAVVVVLRVLHHPLFGP